MGAKEAPKHPEKQAESRRRFKEVLKIPFLTRQKRWMGLPHLNLHGLDSLFQCFH